VNEEIEERLDALERGKAATLPFWEKCRNRKNRIIEVAR
jgi:hypothetical protein